MGKTVFLSSIFAVYMHGIIVAVLLVICSVNAWGQKGVVAPNGGNYRDGEFMSKLKTKELAARKIWDKWYGAPIEPMLDIATPTKYMVLSGDAKYYDSLTASRMIVDSADKKIILWASIKNLVSGTITMKDGTVYEYQYNPKLSNAKGMAIFTTTVPINFNVNEVILAEWDVLGNPYTDDEKYCNSTYHSSHSPYAFGLFKQR